MAASSFTLKNEEEILLNNWNDAKKAKVLKDFTSNYKDRFVLVKKDTISHKYEHCFFYFYDEDGNEVSENLMQVALNITYFEKIN